MKKSKSMEFLKSKILRKPSTSKQRSSPACSSVLLGHPMFELHKSSNHSLPPKSKDVLHHDLNDKKSAYGTNFLHSASSINCSDYDWRQDTPFWKPKKPPRRNWMLANEPTNWVPPFPSPYRPIVHPATYSQNLDDWNLEAIRLEYGHPVVALSDSSERVLENMIYTPLYH